MNLGSRRTILSVVTVVFPLCVASAFCQAVPEQKPQMAENVFKNVQVLKGLSVNEFMGTMGFIAASLSMNCIDCHVTASASNVEKFADDTPVKQTARRMILMVKNLNATNFGGKRMVTCYSCHRGDERPKITPSLATQYGTPPPEDPNDIEAGEEAPGPGTPSADQIFDKYIQSLGGAQQLAKLTSFVAKGTYQGYDTGDKKVPLEVLAKAPSQRTAIAHLPEGDLIRTFDGNGAWMTSAGTLLPIPVLELTGGELEGAKLEADLSFPARIKQTLTELHVGDTAIDDNNVFVVQGTSSLKTTGIKTPIKLFFDKKSGLLVRVVRYSDTSIGFNPTQIDYSDYRDVSGVKMPFRWVTTWTDGRSTAELTQVQPNVAIAASKLAKPAAQVRPKPANP
jgi:outer membrane lipoprotein-sorting protein